MGLVYLDTCMKTININQMYVNTPCMDPMGYIWAIIGEIRVVENGKWADTLQLTFGKLCRPNRQVVSHLIPGGLGMLRIRESPPSSPWSCRFRNYSHSNLPTTNQKKQNGLLLGPSDRLFRLWVLEKGRFRYVPCLKEKPFAPENWGLEDDPFVCGWPIIQGGSC